MGFMPQNIYMPFFSYGIFRPGEIAYSLIQDYVDESKIKKINISGELLVRDGLLIYKYNSVGHIEGYLLEFKVGKEEEAYKQIEAIEPKEYYTWNSDISVFKNKFNLLYGKSVEKGVDENKSNFKPEVFDSLFSSVWYDPFFIKGFKLLNEIKDKNIFNSILNEKQYPGWDEEQMFNKYMQIQFQYTFLWSLIERFTFLSYKLGGNPNQRNSGLYNDPDLLSCFNKLINDKKFSYLKAGFFRSINPSDKPSVSYKWELNPLVVNDSNSKKMIDFYYGLRSNIIHRGKSGMNKLDLLECSFKELLFIFENLWDIKKNKGLDTKTRVDLICNL